ncbi:hypothetical protein [Dictyobacter halimunensis]
MNDSPSMSTSNVDDGIHEDFTSSIVLSLLTVLGVAQVLGAQ